MPALNCGGRCRAACYGGLPPPGFRASSSNPCMGGCEGGRATCGVCFAKTGIDVSHLSDSSERVFTRAHARTRAPRYPPAFSVEMPGFSGIFPAWFRAVVLRFTGRLTPFGIMRFHNLRASLYDIAYAPLHDHAGFGLALGAVVCYHGFAPSLSLAMLPRPARARQAAWRPRLCRCPGPRVREPSASASRALALARLTPPPPASGVRP